MLGWVGSQRYGGGSCRGGVGHKGMGWVMQGRGGSNRGGVGHAGVGHIGEGWVMQG